MKNGWTFPSMSKAAEKVYYQALPGEDKKRRAKAKAALSKSSKPPRSANGSGKKMEAERAATAALQGILG